MSLILARVLMWIAGKAMVYVVILGLLLAVFVVKVVPPMVVEHHEKGLERAISELSDTRALVGDLAVRADVIKREMEDKRRELGELNEERKVLNAWITKAKNFFNKDEVEAKKSRLAARKVELLKGVELLKDEEMQVQIDGGESEEALKEKELLRDERERQLRDVEGLRATFESLMRNELRGLAVVALGILGLIIIGPFLWKVVGFYVVARVAESSRPISLGVDAAVGEEVSVTASHPAQRVVLELGEVMMTKVDYLQTTMGDFEKKTRWLIDWRYPFSSMAARLFMLTEIRNGGEMSGEVTLSTREDATEELAVVTLPVGRAMVFRPHYLAAVVYPEGALPRISSRWVFRKLHAWVNLQFRYMIVEGPVRLVFCAQRGIQAEDVLPELPGRRVNSNLTVAFSPHLNYSPRRAETFVAYMRGKNGLFDDFFEGSGCVLQQQVSTRKKNPGERFWGGIFGTIGKVFGI